MSTSIILASSSSTRRDLMNRLHLNYQAISPNIDESPQLNETAQELSIRLSIEKAAIISKKYPDAIVIGSDQVAWLPNSPTTFIGKPYTVENAIAQLQQQSGQTLNFSTGLSVQCTHRNIMLYCTVPFQVKFRQLTDAEIHRYIQYDQPLHCAGSFKCESLGMTLFESMQGEDYTALMGLPLIQLCHFLRQLGVTLP